MNRVKEYRLALGLTQSQLSRELKRADPRMDVGMVSRIENGACLPTERVLIELERALQARRTDLYSADDIYTVESLEGIVEPQESSSLTELLVSYIPIGRDNAIRRDDLAWKMGLPDRSVRNAIEQARGAGMLIINDGDGRGYYRSDEVEDLVRQYRQDTRRALSILYRRKTIRRKLKDAGVDVNQI